MYVYICVCVYIYIYIYYRRVVGSGCEWCVVRAPVVFRALVLAGGERYKQMKHVEQYL